LPFRKRQPQPRAQLAAICSQDRSETSGHSERDRTRGAGGLALSERVKPVADIPRIETVVHGNAGLEIFRVVAAA
jgi:hypothetical protein